MTFSQSPSIHRTVSHLIQCTAFTIACIVGLARFCGAQCCGCSSSSVANLAVTRPFGSQEDSGPRCAEPAVQPKTSVERPVSPKLLIPNILHDQRTTFLFPVQVAKGHHLQKVLPLLGITAGMVVLDPYDEPYFRNSSGFNSFKTGPLRGRNTTLAMMAAPVGLYLGGLARHDSYAKNTALLAAESIVDAQILSLGIKLATGRSHPSDIPPHGNFRNTWFKYNGTLTNPGSFPSGHATTAFAIAAVLARRYRQHRWVPFVAYTGATFVALTRIPDQAHFPSDIFAGSAMGYILGHYVIFPH
jgi:membrane-associated phospholipid phosphatase